MPLGVERAISALAIELIARLLGDARAGRAGPLAMRLEPLRQVDPDELRTPTVEVQRADHALAANDIAGEPGIDADGAV